MLSFKRVFPRFTQNTWQ